MRLAGSHPVLSRCAQKQDRARAPHTVDLLALLMHGGGQEGPVRGTIRRVPADLPE